MTVIHDQGLSPGRSSSARSPSQVPTTSPDPPEIVTFVVFTSASAQTYARLAVVHEAPVSGVLFDWRGTLVCDPEDEVWLRSAAARLDRHLDSSTVTTLLRGLEAAAQRPDLASRLTRADCSTAEHRAVNLDVFRAAGMDDELAVSSMSWTSTPRSTHSSLMSPPCSPR